MQAGRNTLSKSERLCSESRIDTLFSRGRRGSVGPLRFCWVVTPAADSAGQDMHLSAANVSVLFSVPKKAFKMAWKRNLIKRRMRESYRQRKHELIAAAVATERHIDIAFICFPGGEKGGLAGAKRVPTGAKGAKVVKGAKGTATVIEIPDFKTIDDAIAKILEQITARTRA